MTPMTAAARLALCEAYMKLLEAESAHLRTELLKEMTESEAGNLKPRDPDREVLATITNNSGRVSPRILDEDAFFDYVLANHPDEIQVKEEVTSAFRTKVLAAIKKDNGRYVGADGTPQPWAGVNVGEPYLSVKVTDAAFRYADLHYREMLPRELPPSPVTDADALSTDEWADQEVDGAV